MTRKSVQNFAVFFTVGRGKTTGEILVIQTAYADNLLEHFI